MTDFTGSFEQKGRTPILGVVLILCICGALYYIFQMLFGNVVTLLNATFADVPFVGSDEGYKLSGAFLYFFCALLIVDQAFFLVILPIIIFRRWHRKDVFHFFGYAKINPYALAGLVASFFVIPLVGVMAGIMHLMLPTLKEAQRFGVNITSAFDVPSLTVILVTIGLTPAICEEFFFRCMLQKNMQRFVAWPWAIALSTLSFSLFHFNLLYLPVYLLLGLTFGLLYYVSGSPYPSMIMHGFYNSTLVLMDNDIFPSGLLSPDGETFVWPVNALSLVFMAGMVGILIFFAMKKASKTAENQVTAQ